MAVYTDVSFEELEVFLAAYALGEPYVFKGIAEGVSNSNYYLQTVKGTFILTLYEMRVDAVDLPFYLGLMEHLARAGIPCPTPVHARNGDISGLGGAFLQSCMMPEQASVEDAPMRSALQGGASSPAIALPKRIP